MLGDKAHIPVPDEPQFRLTIEGQKEGGGWKVVSVQVRSESFLEHFMLLTVGLDRALKAGAVTRDDIARLAAGWLGITDPDQFMALPEVDRMRIILGATLGPPDRPQRQ